jgi:hypothetical protein
MDQTAENAANFDPTRMWLVTTNCGAPHPINRMDVIKSAESDRVPLHLYQKLKDLFFCRKVALDRE